MYGRNRNNIAAHYMDVEGNFVILYNNDDEVIAIFHSPNSVVKL